MKKVHKRRLQQLIALLLVAAMWWQTDSMRFFSTAYGAESEVSESTNLSSDNELTKSDSLSTFTVRYVAICQALTELPGYSTISSQTFRGMC